MTEAVNVAFTAGLFGTIAVFANMFNDKLKFNREQKKKNKVKALSPIDGISQKAQFSADAYKLMLDSEIDRIVLYKATNGGGIINLVTPMYVTCLDEATTNEVGSIKDKMQRWQTDSAYNEMLSRIISKGVINCKVDEMDNSQLRNIYRLAHLNESVVWYLGEMKGKNQEVYYVSFETMNKTGISEETRTTIAFMVNKYKVIIEDAIKEKQLSDEN